MTIDLDSPSSYSSVDKAGMLGKLLELESQIGEAWSLAEQLEAPPEARAARNIVVLGMGGSAIGGDIARTLIAPMASVPVSICRDYQVPQFVGPDTLVLASSHSGGTEETLSATRQALDAGAQVVAMTTGGRLGELARVRGLPLLRFAHVGQPRAAIGYSLFLALGTLARLGYLRETPDLPGIRLAISATMEPLGPDIPAQRNPAKRLALRLHGRLPVVYGGGILTEVARRWKGQFNENSKNWAFFEQLPEAHHNAVVGFEFPKELLDKIVVILLTASLNSPRMQIREHVTQEFVAQRGIDHEVVPARGDSVLAQVCSAIAQGDIVSYYLALLNGADPSTIAAIDELKAALAAAASTTP